MKLTISGASGKAGRHVVEQALEAGHEVTAFVRDPAKLGLSHERLGVVRGDITDEAKVREAVRGSEAVVSAPGQTRSSSRDVLTVAAGHLVPAMEEEGARRLVSLVGAGVPDERDTGSLGRTLIRGLMKMVARHVLEDAERHAELVRDSALDWTLVRPPRLTARARTGTYRDVPGRTGTYRAGYLQLGARNTISRADLADFMLRLASDGRYVREAPMVSC
jgi:putative NADH-flavin reductase